MAYLFGFNLFVYGANIWIVFNDDSIGNMVLDCVAMEFLMTLDNEFEIQYFDYLPEAAVDIYDNVFVDYGKNYEMVHHFTILIQNACKIVKLCTTSQF